MMSSRAYRGKPFINLKAQTKGIGPKLMDVLEHVAVHLGFGSEIWRKKMDHLDVWPGPDGHPLCIETSDHLWPLLEESSVLLPIEDDNINDVLDASVLFPEQENSALAEPRIIDDRSLQKNGLNFHQDDSLSTINLNPNNSWPLVRESNIDHKYTNNGLDSGVLFLEQELSALAESSTDKGTFGKGLNCETSESNNRFKRLQTRKKVVEPNAEEGSVAKKQDHNAKERVRRRKLNESYQALASFLPDSRRSSKKRWSAPIVIDRVLEYIPELENELKKLTLKKKNILLAHENQQNLEKTRRLKLQAPTVSVHEVKEGEVIFQICLQIDRRDILSNLILNVEAEGMCIESASTFHICDDRVCYHLHIIQMVGTSFGLDWIAVLREKVTFWLCN